MKPPRQRTGKRPTEYKAPEDQTEAPAPKPKAGSENDSGKPSEEEVASHWKDPVTNQDEQEKITNNGADDIPVANK